MTKLLEEALDLVRRLPADSQDEIARAMLSLAQPNEGGLEAIDPAHLPDRPTRITAALMKSFNSSRWKFRFCRN